MEIIGLWGPAFVIGVGAVTVFTGSPAVGLALIVIGIGMIDWKE
jgi:hypothetical protein